MPLLATGDKPVAGTLSATTSAAALGSQACAAVLVRTTRQRPAS
jgi:hypothetical protein